MAIAPNEHSQSNDSLHEVVSENVLQL